MDTSYSRPVFQVGAAKSGNFWLYKILEGLLDLAGEPRRSFIQNQPIYEEAKHWKLSYPEQAGIDVLWLTGSGYTTKISSGYEAPITDLDDYCSQTRHIWSHAPFRPDWSPQVFERVRPVIHIVRDPRDVMLSHAEFVFTPYFQENFSSPFSTLEEFIAKRVTEFPRHWAYHVRGFMEAARRYHVHFVHYERLLANFREEAALMNEVLGFAPLSETQMDELQQAVAFKTLRTGREGHVNKGQAGRWRQHLSEEQNDMVLQQAADEIERLDYPLRLDEPARLPDRFEVIAG